MIWFWPKSTKDIYICFLFWTVFVLSYIIVKAFLLLVTSWQISSPSRGPRSILAIYEAFHWDILNFAATEVSRNIVLKNLGVSSSHYQSEQSSSETFSDVFTFSFSEAETKRDEVSLTNCLWFSEKSFFCIHLWVSLVQC